MEVNRLFDRTHSLERLKLVYIVLTLAVMEAFSPRLNSLGAGKGLFEISF